ncbi:FUSC family protein [Microbacterium terricola]|uniref:Integral membrane bound transporter domain-containing protein n=1 Tax=Microbacterium terricola TaxID=344163 RepID=A0ABM8DWZ6_9MICO|nr:FUSC family protein [Microbacterium terricola]UYK39148.1 FUSC family protein [Microbacterium terricola]BDV30137.1 hypothetical protein Microterr_07970 [Microbacterium terricola]
MSPRPPIAWSWRNAAYGAVLALPAAVVSLAAPSAGVALAVGVLPAAALGLRSTRAERRLVVLIGGVAGLSLFIGSLVAPWPALAVLTVFALCVGVALLTADPARRLAPLVLMLGLPLFGAGLSSSSWTGALSGGLLILAGSVYAWLVSLAWPPAASVARPPRSAAPRSAMLAYGVQIGLAGAVAAACGFALGVDHPGWACTAALLVSRPDRRQLDARGWGRAFSVIGGALVACLIALANPSNAAIAVLAFAVIAIGTGTSGSRWYVFPFFSTVLVLSLLLLDDTEPAAHWFLERVGMTLLGIALALLAAWAVPAVARRHAARPVPPS